MDSLRCVIVGFVQCWQSQSSTESKPVESITSTNSPQPSSSELYDPLEGTESDNEDDDATPTTSGSSASSSSIHSTLLTRFSAGVSASHMITPVSGFPPVPAAARGISFPRPPPGVPMPGMASTPNLPGRLPVPIHGLPNAMLPGGVLMPPRALIPPISRFPPHVPRPAAHFPPVTVPPVATTQLPTASVSGPPSTTASTHTPVSTPGTSKSSATSAVSKSESSKRRFTEEKEEDHVPDDLFGYRVSSVTRPLE